MDGFYFEMLTGEIIPCTDNCSNCYGPDPDECKLCVDGLLIEGTRCV
jgi:hypothetical protein